jgi:hypothetical protein
MLGVGESKKYLVLFQNNKIVSPTGGTLEAFGILALEKGKITSFKTHSSSAIDKNLKGFVRPPEPLTAYKDENQWLFRDANWDPDFATTARRVEWFVDKSLGEKVDGVIALNLDFINLIAKETSPIENTEAPGILKDAFIKLQNASADQIANILAQVVSLGKTNDLMLYANNTETQQVLGASSFSEPLLPPECTGNCQSVLIGLVETAISESVDSTAILRAAELNIAPGIDSIKYALNLKLTNNSQTLYETYLRVIAPPDSKFSLVTVQAPGANSFVRPDFKLLNQRSEAGIHVNIEAGKTVSLVFNWENPSKLNFEGVGILKILWIKQPGIVLNSGTINLNLPKGNYTIDKSLSLTDSGSFTYNTNLSENLYTQIILNNEN